MFLLQMKQRSNTYQGV